MEVDRTENGQDSHEMNNSKVQEGLEDKLQHDKDDDWLVTKNLSSTDLTELPSHVITNNHVKRLLVDYNELTGLPDSFGKSLIDLEFFSAIGNNISRLPSSFGELCQLSEIYLNENGLKCLPESFCHLKCLKKVKLTGNELDCLPENFGELESLELLHCDENNLSKLPKTFGLLERLVELELGCNSLSVLSEGFGMLMSLQILNLCNNNLEILPESFGNLPSLKTLDISCNKIKSLPQNCKSTDTLQKFYTDSNLLHDLPGWVSSLSQIKELSAKDNQFQNQPINDDFANGCVKLKRLDLSGNFISNLPENLGDCSQLEFLHFGSVIGELERRNFQNGNWLAAIPDSICKLEHLRELHLDENQLTELPKEFGQLISLETLDLGQNLLHELPESFGNLASLKVCLLSKNHIQWLPSSFGNLKSLEDLRLDDNELGELPESFGMLSSLKSLDLFSNHLRDVPDALHSLTNLVRLDLDANDFNVPLSEIPLIVSKSKYPQRDPRLKDDWRGRPRQDIVNMENEIVKVDECSILDFEPPPPPLNFSEDYLISAMERNLSIWKHGSESSNRHQDRRPRHTRHRCRLNRNKDDMDFGGEDSSNEGSDVGDNDESNQSDNTSDDEFVPPLFVKATKWSGSDKTSTINPPSSTNNTESTSVIEETECWDDEVESLPELYDNVQVDVHPTKMYYPPVYNGCFTFVPHDLHVDDYIKRPNVYPVEDDQFENCDDDQTSEISVDPIF